jgi:hypothetical protein
MSIQVGFYSQELLTIQFWFDFNSIVSTCN